MKKLPVNLLRALLDGSSEPLLVAKTDHPDWPVVFCNQAFGAVADADPDQEQSFTDVIEALVGREVALEISEVVRAGEATSLPVEIRGDEYLLTLSPVSFGDDQGSAYYAAYWRGGTGSTAALGDAEARRALQKARRRIRDLSREDPVTGLLNARTFSEVLAHDWAVAARENAALALTCLSLDDFDAYIKVFGRHAADSCLRRVGQVLRRRLRRASDVAARIESDRLIVLAHGSSEAAVREFALAIAATVRELGLHHPHSKVSRFVTLSFEIAHQQVGTGKMTAEGFLQSVLDR